MGWKEPASSEGISIITFMHWRSDLRSAVILRQGRMHLARSDMLETDG
jgi:hypothetical protein